MLIANVFVGLTILGCAAYLFLKGTFVKAFATLITIICASVVAFSYFEILASVLIGRSKDTEYSSLASWAQPLSFVLLFVLTFAILQTIVIQLTRRPVDLGPLPEYIGRALCGIFIGFFLSGLLLMILAMSPLPNKYPYQRFDENRPEAQSTNKVLFNADSFATGWFSIISRGSFRGQRSFATTHPSLPDQAFLNRLRDDIPIVTSSEAIEVPRKAAAWIIPAGLRNAEDPNEQVEPKSGYNLTIVRVGIKRNAAKDASRFTLSQLRLICKQKGSAEDPLAGKGINIYPLGYLKTADQLHRSQLNDQIKIADFKEGVSWMDFVFEVPDDFYPVLVEFKQNNIAEVPPLVPAEQAPPVVSSTEPMKGEKSPLTVLMTFAIVKFSRSNTPNQDKQQPIPTAKVSQIRKFIQTTPVTPKLEIARPDRDQIVGGTSRLLPANQVFSNTKPRPQNPVTLVKASVSQVVSTSGNANLSHKIEFFGSWTEERKICYLVDCSGSMQGTFGRVRKKLVESVKSLQPDQYFYIIFFGGDKLFELGSGRLLQATEENKSAAYNFIQSVRPAGQTNAMAAMERVVQIRDGRGTAPSIVYFLTDGSELTSEDSQRFSQKITSLLKQFAPETKINTIGFWLQDNDRKMLETIAQQTGGELVVVADSVIDNNDNEDSENSVFWNKQL